jgi:hypothetical protein
MTAGKRTSHDVVSRRVRWIGSRLDCSVCRFRFAIETPARRF